MAEGNTGWTYDANGNRTRQESGATYSYAYLPPGNRLLSLTGPVAKTYQYDPAGNVIHDDTYGFTHNDYGRLSQLTWNGQTTGYRYDGLGQRVQKTGRGAANGLERYVHDEAGRLLGEYGANGSRLRETVWLEDRPVAVIPADGPPLQVHADHLNAPRALTDAANRVVWRWDGDAFGVGAADEDPDGDGIKVSYNLRFPGQYFDGESGLHYNVNRYYEPRTGRYVEADPIGVAGGLNLYAYVDGNPLSYVDPEGLRGVGPQPVPMLRPQPLPPGPMGAFPYIRQEYEYEFVKNRFYEPQPNLACTNWACPTSQPSACTSTNPSGDPTTWSSGPFISRPSYDFEGNGCRCIDRGWVWGPPAGGLPRVSNNSPKPPLWWRLLGGLRGR